MKLDAIFCLLPAYIVKYTFFSNSQTNQRKSVFCKVDFAK